MALNVHRGSFLGLPDFGVSEFLSDRLGKQRTPQGGSNLFGGNTQTQAASPQNVLDASSEQNMSQAPMGPFLSEGQRSSGGGGGGAAPTQNDQLKDAAVGEDQALLSRLQGEFGQNASRLQDQLGFAGQNKDLALQTLSNQEQSLRSRTAQEETRSKRAVENAIGEAGSTAKNVQRENRNILRSLGILSSSAAGEMLGKPMTQFDKERARLARTGMERVTQLKDYLDNGLNQLNVAKQQVENQYGQLVSQIQSDLRFNDFQRAQAIKDANAALKSRFAEIDNMTAQISGQVSSAQNSIVQAIQEQAGLALPQAQGQSIMATGIDPNAQAREQVGIYDPREDDPLLSQV